MQVPSSALLAILALASACGRAPPLGSQSPSLVGDLPSATLDRPYASRLILTPPSSTPPVVDVVVGSIPPGLVLAATPTELTLRGTPVSAGRFDFTLAVRVSTPRVEDFEADLGVDVQIPVPDEPLELRSRRLADGLVGQPYEARLEATGGLPPYRFTSENELPVGLSLTLDGVVQGIPERAARGTFTARVEDAIGQSVAATVGLDVGTTNVPGVANPDLPPARVLRSFSTTLQGVGGDGGPYDWRLLRGRFPPGLDLRLRRGRTAELTGVPTEVGRFSYTIELTDGLGVRGTTEGEAEIVPPLAVVTDALPGATIGQAYDVVIFLENVLPPLTVEPFGIGLPPGLRLEVEEAGTVRLVGEPFIQGTFRFQLRFRDASDEVIRPYQLLVRR